MGIKSAFGKVGRFVSFSFGVTSAKRSIAQGAAVIKELSDEVKADASRGAAAEDTFEGSCERYGLDAEALRRIEQSLLTMKRVSVVMLYVAMGSAVAHLALEMFLGAAVAATLVPLLAVVSVRQQFRLTQVRRKKLLSFKEFRAIPGWLRDSLSPEFG